MIERVQSREHARGWQRFKLDALGAGEPERRVNDRRGPPPADAELALDAARHEGFRHGYAEAQAKVKTESDQLHAVAAQFAVSVAAFDQELAERLLDLALDVARQILRSDVKARREALLPVVREAMQCLPDQAQRPQLLLNPADVDLVRARIGDELQLNGLSIVEDHRIEPGGCRISAINCEVDATLPARWRRVLAALGKDVSWSDA